MADQQTAETAEQDQTDAATAEGTEGQDQEQQTSEPTDENREAIATALKKANKEAEKYRRQARETENQKKTADEENVTLKEENDGLRGQLLALEMALTYELPADLIPMLSGKDREEIEAKAKALKAHLKPTAATDFDSGPRDVVEKPLTAEEAHQSTLVNLLRAKGKLPPT